MNDEESESCTAVPINKESFFFLKTDRGPAGQSRQNSQPAVTHSWNPSNFFVPDRFWNPNRYEQVLSE